MSESYMRRNYRKHKLARIIYRFFSKKFGIKIHPFVFPISALFFTAFIVFSLFFTEQFALVLKTVEDFFTNYFSGFYILSVNVFILVVLYMAFSRLGDIRIGGPTAKKEFSSLAWMAMLFSAGMGVGLVFNGAYEPLFHYANAPAGESQTVQAAQDAIALSFFHWGFHPWAIYGLVSLAIAFFSYNWQLPFSFRSIFYSLFGRSVFRSTGNYIDIIATVASLFGLAASMGMGVLQITSGLQEVFHVPLPDTALYFIFIALITVIASMSVLLGIKKGVKKLSEINIALAIVLLAIVFILGPSLFLNNSMVQDLGYYLNNIITYSTRSFVYEQGNDWYKSWTVMYWAWWIAWSPFVGMFIARISKGYSIREFLLYVMVVPSLFTFLWFNVFGNTAINLELFGHANNFLVNTANTEPSMVIFNLFKFLPWTLFLSILALIVLIIFFVTSLDSGTLVIDYITSGGFEEKSTFQQKLFWLLAVSFTTLGILLSGGIESIKSVVTIAGFPFTIALWFVSFSLIKSLRREYNNEHYPDYLNYNVSNTDVEE